jgi:hypothetical protein
MDPGTMASLAVGAVVRYVSTKVAGVAGKAAQDLDGVVDDRLDRIYETVRERLGSEQAGGRALDEVEADPGDARRQGKLELAVETAVEGDAAFAARLAELLEDLAERPPAGGTSIRDAGPVAGGNVTIQGGRDAAGRDLSSSSD